MTRAHNPPPASSLKREVPATTPGPAPLLPPASPPLPIAPPLAAPCLARRQFSLRGLLAITFVLAALLTLYRHLPAGSLPLALEVTLALAGVLYFCLMLWGGIVCLLELLRMIWRKLDS